MLQESLPSTVACMCAGASREPCGWGLVKLSFPEIKWLISCSIVTEHYLFQPHKATLFSYLPVVGAGG